MSDKSRLIGVLGGLALMGGVAAVPLMIAFDSTGWGGVMALPSMATLGCNFAVIGLAD